MASKEWSTTTLGEIAFGENGLVDGPFGSNLPASAYTENGVPVIRGSNLSLGVARFDSNEFVYVSDEDANKLSRSICKPGDIVFTKKGTIGQTGIIPQDSFARFLLSSNQMKLTVNPAIANPLFVYYVVSFRENREKIIRDASVTGVPKINVAYLKTFPIDMPPLSEQRAIAHILGSLDDKIELNRRMNETLEEMARAIFKSWFVDFDPVRAKAEGRDPGLPKHIADFLPDRFEDSELGEIPAGWDIDSLGDLVELAYGKALKQSVRKPGNIAVFGSNGRVGWHDERLVEGPGIIVGRKGNPGLVTWSPTDFFPIDTSFYIVPRARRLSLPFLLYALKTHDLPSLAADSAVPGLNRNFVYQNQQIVPSAPVLDAFDSVVKQLFHRIHKADEESNVLASIRDTLLPRLLSGELRVGGSSLLEGTD